MRTGELRHRVTIQSSTKTLDSGGFDQSEVFTDVATVWAKVEPVNAYEQWQADQSRPEATHRVTIRSRTDVESKYRITTTLHGQSRVFEIKGIRRVPDERNIWLEMLCQELPAQ